MSITKILTWKRLQRYAMDINARTSVLCLALVIRDALIVLSCFVSYGFFHFVQAVHVGRHDALAAQVVVVRETVKPVRSVVVQHALRVRMRTLRGVTFKGGVVLRRPQTQFHSTLWTKDFARRDHVVQVVLVGGSTLGPMRAILPLRPVYLGVAKVAQH